MLEEISSDLTDNLQITVIEICDEGDEYPTYLLQWEYKNTYYELFGKISEEEMSNIARKILY